MPLYKVILSPRPAYPEYMPPASLGSSRWRQLYLGRLVATTHGWRHPGPGGLAILVWYLQAFIKRQLGISSSSPAWASDGEDLGWLLAQPALQSKPTSSARCRGDPWDAIRRVALPLAYLGGHPHDTSPQNRRSLMGQHGASVGSFPRRSLLASVEVPGIHIRLQNC
jgi:hypothetical protein